MTPEGRPDTWWELVLYGAALIGLGGGGGAAMRHRFGGKVTCEAEAAKRALQEQLQRSYDAHDRALNAVLEGNHQAEVRHATTNEQIRTLLRAVADCTQSVNRLVAQLEADRRARNGGGR